jgi:sigma-B regulation protein RsbU (phosphoserine phosphatase)
MARINRNLGQSVPGNRYATLFLARLVPATGQLRYVNAGHHAPVLLRSDGALERLTEGGTVLGTFEGAEYAEGSVVLAPGDLLVVFSDGVAEAADEEGGAFGEKRLADVLREHSEGTAADVAHGVLRAIADHAGTHPSHDDWTLIVAKRC